MDSKPISEAEGISWDEPMVPMEITDNILGNWDIREYDVMEIDTVSDDSPHFNAIHGVFKIGYYETGTYPIRVFIKGYGNQGLDIESGLSEAVSLALIERLGGQVPRYAIDIRRKISWQQEVFGRRFDKISDHQVEMVSKDQYLNLASVFPVLGADDFRPPNLFVGLNGRIWPIDLDSAMSDMTEVGEFYKGDNRKFRETVQRIIRTAELFSFEVTEEEVLEKIQETSEYIVRNEIETFQHLISDRLSEEKSHLITNQIKDFSRGEFSEYNDTGEKRTSLTRRFYQLVRNI